MKKNIKIVLTMIMCFTLIFSGCQKSADGTKESNKKATTTGAKSSNTESTTNETKKVTEFDAFIGRSRVVKDYNTNEFIKWREEQTGIKINFDQVFIDQIEERRNLVMSTGEYPDIMINSRMDKAQVDAYGKDAIFIRLNELIDEHMPNLKAYLEANPHIEKELMDLDGNIYALPDVSFKYHQTHPRKMWIYKPWLDKLSLKIPQTTEELVEVLTAFKEKDPNGNGKRDEIPMAGAIKGWEANVAGFLLTSFQIEDGREANRNGVRLINRDGIIEFTANTDGYRDGLRYIKSLYDQGLITPESFTQNQKQLKQMGENPDVPILGVGAYGWVGGITINNGESGRYKDYVALPPLEGPTGLRQTFTVLEKSTPTAMITEKCEDPVTVAQWFDYLYSEEGTLNSENGLDGWKPAAEGAIGYNGEQAKYEISFVFGEEQNSAACDLPGIRGNQLTGSYMVNDETATEVRLYRYTQEDYAPYGVNVSVPVLQFVPDVQVEEVEIRTSLIAFVDSAEARFITGDMDIENDWDGYLKELKNRGVDRYIEIYQQAYDKMYK